MNHVHGVDSEVGRLRTVLLHRPGPELKRLTPRNSVSLLFDAIPWLDRAQTEHDAFAQALRDSGVEVLYLTELLTQILHLPEARADVTRAVFAYPQLGQSLQRRIAAHLADLSPEDLTLALIAGISRDELPTGGGLRWTLMDPQDFVVEPLPNLLFTRDSSVWIRDTVTVANPPMPARYREATLAKAIYTYHPRFADTSVLYQTSAERVESGDVLLLAPGVLAVGMGQRTTPAGVERLARRSFANGTAHTVLAVPIAQQRATMHLDTICTMVDVNAMVMYSPIAEALTAYTLTPADEPDGDLAIVGPAPFLTAAAAAMGIDTLRHIDTGLDPVTAEREQWDDGANTLAIAPRLCVAYERNTQTNARLAEEGIDVITIPSSELVSGRGGPRCMSCPISRDLLG